MRKTLTAAILAAATGVALLASAGAASARVLPGLPGLSGRASVAYEVDNGTTWTLADSAGASGRVSSTGPEEGYADTGVVVDLGKAQNFTGITVTGSGNLAENIWIADGSEATVPGTHPLSSPVNFDYGLGQPGGTWYMVGKPDAYNNQMLTDAQIRSDFAGYEVYAWVGIDDAGTNASGYVTIVNGHMAAALLSISASAGKVTAFAEPIGF